MLHLPSGDRQPRIDTRVTCDMSMRHISVRPRKATWTTLPRPRSGTSCRFKSRGVCASRTLRKSHSLRGDESQYPAPIGLIQRNVGLLDALRMIRKGKDRIALVASNVPTHVGRYQRSLGRSMRCGWGVSVAGGEGDKATQAKQKTHEQGRIQR